jgi:hypothetical protein
MVVGVLIYLSVARFAVNTALLAIQGSNVESATEILLHLDSETSDMQLPETSYSKT